METRVVVTDVIDTIEKIDTLCEESEIVACFSNFIEKFGFETIAMGYLVNPNTPESQNFRFVDWPEDWYRYWDVSHLIIHDPIAKFSLGTRNSFTWAEAYNFSHKHGKTILDESRNFGFSDGLAIPIWSPSSPPGCVSLGAENIDLSPRERACVELVAVHFYSRLEVVSGPRQMQAIKPLSRRETEVVQYAASGKTNWEIGKILSISENTVREYMTSAMHKLNCVNRAHTVAAAIQKSLILP